MQEEYRANKGTELLEGGVGGCHSLGLLRSSAPYQVALVMEIM